MSAKIVYVSDDPERDMVLAARKAVVVLEELVAENRRIAVRAEIAMNEAISRLSCVRAVLAVYEGVDIGEEGCENPDTSDIPEAAEEQLAAKVVASQEPAAKQAASEPASRSLPREKPDGTPTVASMVASVLRDGGSMTVKQIAEKIGARWWPGIVASQIAAHVSMLKKAGKLDRTGGGGPDDEYRYSPAAEKPAPAAPPSAASKPQVVSTGRGKTPEPIGGANGESVLEHEGKGVILPQRERRLVDILLPGMGRGMIPCDHIMSKLGLPKGGGYFYIAGVRDTANPRLAEVGLQIDAYMQSGFFIKEI